MLLEAKLLVQPFMLDRSKGMDMTRTPRWGLGLKLITLPQKTTHVKELDAGRVV
jgi:hypothetical protein